MEALQGEADQTSPEQEQMGLVVLPTATAHSLGLLGALLHIFFPCHSFSIF